MFAAHPFLGVGLGGYWIGITAYHDASGLMTPQEAHNDYLELLSSGGLIGFAIGVWFVVVDCSHDPQESFCRYWVSSCSEIWSSARTRGRCCSQSCGFRSAHINKCGCVHHFGNVGYGRIKDTDSR